MLLKSLKFSIFLPLLLQVKTNLSHQQTFNYLLNGFIIAFWPFIALIFGVHTPLQLNTPPKLTKYFDIKVRQTSLSRTFEIC